MSAMPTDREMFEEILQMLITEYNDRFYNRFDRKIFYMLDAKYRWPIKETIERVDRMMK